MIGSSVSPERSETHDAVAVCAVASAAASMASDSVPIWLTFHSSELAAPDSIPLISRAALVMNRSSPTIWMPDARVSSAKPSKSFSSKRVLDRDDAEVADQLEVQARSARRGRTAARRPGRCLLVGVVEVAGRAVEPVRTTSGVAGPLDRLVQQPERLARVADLRHVAALVTECSRATCRSAQQHRAEREVDLGALGQRLVQGRGAGRDDDELLELELSRPRACRR